jgi:hypothetical protein
MQRALVALVVVAAIGGSVAGSAAASCAPVMSEDPIASTDVLFGGLSLPGPTKTNGGRSRILRSITCLASRPLAPAGTRARARRWRPALTIAGRFGIALLVDARRPTGRGPLLAVRSGERLRFRFNFAPRRVALRYGRSRPQRLRARQTLKWPVPTPGTYPVRITATGTRPDRSKAVRFTSRFAIRLKARSDTRVPRP